jgi:hypothetical protein
MVMLAMAGGEYALCILPFFVLYELIAGPGSRGQRARALLPLLGLFVAYVALHRGMGFGSYASNVYVDPAREPGAWLGLALVRVPILVADMFLAIPTGKLALYPELMKVQAVLGPAALLLVGVLVPGAVKRLDAQGRRRVLWLMVAAVLAILPVASSFVSARLLLIPGVGGHAVVAAIVLDGWDRLRDRTLWKKPLTWIRGVLSAALFAAHVGLASWWGLEELLNINRLNEGTRQAALLMQVDDAKVPEQRLIVLTAADPMTLLYPAFVRWVEGHPLPKSWWVLSLAPRAHTLTRVADDALEMEVVGGSMLTGPVELLFRRPEFPFARGDVIELEGLDVRIVKVDADGRPVRVRFRFDVPVDDPSLVFLLATKRGLIRYPIGPVKATMPIPPAMLPLVLDLEAQDRAAADG